MGRIQPVVTGKKRPEAHVRDADLVRMEQSGLFIILTFGSYRKSLERIVKDELRHTHFPYCITKQEDDTYVVTNRTLKPIGFMTGEFVDYSKCPVGVKIKGLTPEIVASLDYQGRKNSGKIYLYGDECTPTSDKKSMDAYLARLAILMTLQIESTSITRR
jgi:hypothetical protein